MQGDEEYRDTIQSMLMQTSHTYFTKGFQQFISRGVHPGQVPLLHALRHQDGLSQKEIADKLNVKPPTVAVSIKRMEKSGLIYRKQDERDQRISRIYLSEKGKSFNEEMKVLLDRNEKILEKNFSESELCLFKRFLRQLIENMDEMKTEYEEEMEDTHTC